MLQSSTNSSVERGDVVTEDFRRLYVDCPTCGGAGIDHDNLCESVTTGPYGGVCVPARCGTCEGDRVVPLTGPEPYIRCPRCQGSRWVKQETHEDVVKWLSISAVIGKMPCPECWFVGFTPYAAEGMTMFVGWYDPDKRKLAETKLAEAVTRYVEKFGGNPTTCLTSKIDALAIGHVDGIKVRAVSYIPRYTYYVGVEEPIDTEVRNE